MLTTLVTRLESSAQYSLIRRRPPLWSRPAHAAVWLQSPAEQGAQHFPLSPCKCLPASRSRTAVRSFANYRLTVADMYSADLHLTDAA